MNAPRYTVADVRRTYDARRAREERYGDWASALVYRPLSFWLTPPLLALRVSANAVTATMLAFSLALPVIAAVLGPQAQGAVGALAFLCMVLDCVDGNIARAAGHSSKLGAYFDFMADIVHRISMYGTVGYIAQAQGGPPAVLVAFGLAAGALAACLSIAARLARHSDGAAAERAYFDTDEVPVRRSGLIERFVFPFLSGSERVLPVLVLLTAATGGLGWVVLWLLCLSFLDFIYTQRVVVSRLH